MDSIGITYEDVYFPSINEYGQSNDGDGKTRYERLVDPWQFQSRNSIAQQM
jgi:hypothetical protein